MIVLAASLLFYRSRQPALPAEGSSAYEQVTRVFYRGLAALDVGLLDNAKQAFTQATEIAPAEPATWANLGVAHLRLGELDAAADPILRAVSLAPRNADVALLAGRMEIARGRIDEGIADLRRAVELGPGALRARYALAQEVEQSGSAGADAEAQRLFDDLLSRVPQNLAVILERTRVAAKRGDTTRVRDSVARLAQMAPAWPMVAREQFEALQRAANGGTTADAARATALLRNVLARVPAYRESLAAVATPAELIAEPFTTYIAMKPPSATPSPADGGLTYTEQPWSAAPSGQAFAVYTPDGTGAPSTFRYNAADVRAVLPLDWNHDLRTDMLLAGPRGVRLMQQSGTGTFTDVTGRAGAGSPVRCDCTHAWAADIEMDGDLDVVLGVAGGPTIVLRNNGDGTWQTLATFASVVDARGFAWADLDGDGDPDAVFLDGTGTLHVFTNRQAGSFAERSDVARGVTAFTVADVDGDGHFDLVTLDDTGAVRTVSASGPSVALTTAIPGSTILAADLDNNGAIDLVVSGSGRTRILLAGADRVYTALPQDLNANVLDAIDLDGDGLLDLDAVAGDRHVRFTAHGTKGYHWKAIRAHAQQNAGDQRINAFGVGGDIEIRSGLLVQKQILTGAPAHFGLGTKTTIDVARIVWPNGVPQAEFDARVDDAIVAEQRLKGSCPWVFAWDGSAMSFVTDFLWRSPLGLRINAQDTAGVTQTEDWVKIRGTQLAPRNGQYDLRITAELWETHFFDHVSLMVVDHPADVDVFVDERFSATHPPQLAAQAVRELRGVRDARDESGRDVTDLVARRDGRYLATFARGAYQGIAAEHAVDFELGADVPHGPGLRLLASGWVYPTDSSINVAIAQGHAAAPRGVALEAMDQRGQWRVIDPDLGFPAGKNKTLVIDLSRVGDARRLRLRTNLEVYWDALEYASATGTSMHTTRLQASSAELRYRGFSQTSSPRGDAPETPHYDRLANTTPRWRDLVGYYTRYGDVRELLTGVDDRYVIMNAGDELRLQYPAPAPPPAGWSRDFVLIGDGWEKDGDFNTGYSQTVLPLPTHARSVYAAASSSPELEDDPVYQQHRGDWEHYHTRYVTPDRFLQGLR